MKKHILYLLILCGSLIPLASNAQIHVLELENDSQTQVIEPPAEIKFNTRLKTNHATVGPVDIIWEKTGWPNEEINFKPAQNLINIGDINGDGYDDLMKSMGAHLDPNSEDEVYSYRTLIFDGKPPLSSEPDIIMYYLLHPAGDLNNDGYDDALGRDYEGNIRFFMGSEHYYQAASIPGLADYYSNYIRSGRGTINIDLNNDSIDDFITFKIQNTDSAYLSITYGSDDFLSWNMNDFTTTDTLDISYFFSLSNDFVVANYAGFFRYEDKMYFGLIGREESEPLPETTYNLYELSDSGKATLLKKYSLGEYLSNTWSVFVRDFNGDTFPDLLARVYTQEGLDLKFLPGTDTFENQYFNAFQYSLFDDIYWVEILGDINKNGKENILVIPQNDSLAYIGDINSSNRFNSYGEVYARELMPDSRFKPHSYYRYPELTTKGDIPSIKRLDSTRSFAATIESNSQFGNSIITFDDESGNTFDISSIEHLFFDGLKYEKIIRDEVYKLNDLESDGIDNFAVREKTGVYYDLVIYNGFYDTAPDTIHMKNTIKPYDVSSGNYLGSSDYEILIHIRDNDIQYLQFYNPDISNETPVYSLPINNLHIGNDYLNDFPIVSNIGDINNDGFHDIAISAPIASYNTSIQQYYFIFLGGETLSTAPDLQYNVNDYMRSLIPGYPTTDSNKNGITLLQSIGDVNGDMIDDFAAAYPKRNYNENSNEGNIMIFFGQDAEVPDFSVPDFELKATMNYNDGFQYGFGGYSELAVGDFNGDGYKDFATKSLQHTISRNDRTGTKGLHFYYGTENGWSAIPDQVIGIKSEYVLNEEDIEFEYVGWMGRVLLSAVDTDNDGDDELLLIPGDGFKNSLLFEVGDGLDEIPEKIFSGLDPDESLQPFSPSINRQYESVTGDFTGNEHLNFIGYHPYLQTHKDTPLLLFDLKSNGTAIENQHERASQFRLFQNYPNPFNPVTSIRFELSKPADVTLTIYNVLGKKVKSLVNGHLTSGNHTFSFDGSGLASGVYFYELTSKEFHAVKKMLLLK